MTLMLKLIRYLPLQETRKESEKCRVKIHRKAVDSNKQILSLSIFMALHFIWWTIPSILVCLSVLAFFDGSKNRVRRGEARDLFRNSIFVVGCIVVSYLIEWYGLDLLEGSVIVEFIPLSFFKWLLLPIVLYFGALFMGPSHSVKISSGVKKRAIRNHSYR
jgi:hypothetical protein